MPASLASAGRTIVQIVGDGNTVMPAHPHLQLTRYLSRRQVRSDLDWLSPYTRSTRLIGREREMHDLRTFLMDPRPTLVRVLTGAGGRGKTRLALELCEWASEKGWSAGFVGRTELTRFLAQPDLSTWGWQRPTLVVIDYAAQHGNALAPLIEDLADRAQVRSPPLRLLLLERHASLHEGWCAGVFARGGFGATSRRALLDPPEPVELAPLPSDESRRALVEDLLGKLTPDGHEARAGEPARLWLSGGRHASGDPLHLMMVALSCAQRGGDPAGRRVDLALTLARREATRIGDLAAARGLDSRLALHLSACVTLMRGLKRAAFEAFAAAEKRAVARPGGGEPAVLADILEQALPAVGGIAPVQPDLIGAAFILDQDIGPEAVLRCYARRGRQVVRTVIHCAQDVAPQRAEPRQWLEAILERIAGDEDALEALAVALPPESVALGEISVRAARHLAAVRTCRAWMPAELRAATLAHLANAHARNGQPEAGLEAAQEALVLYRDLAAQAEIFQPELARALSNTAIMLGEVGQREGALQRAQEAAALCRTLADERPALCGPDLALSLCTLASLQRAVGQHEQALRSAQEAVDRYRALAGQPPERCAPDLALSLVTLAATLSALGQREPALRAAQEAVDRYRDLALQHPDLFAPGLAGALDTLSGLLKDLGRHEPARAAAQEATDLHRALAAQRPEVFLPHLGRSLTHLARSLSALGQREPALQAAREACDIRRQLAAQRPEVFRPALAGSLINLSAAQGAVGQREAALRAAQEACAIRRELAAHRPDLFRPDLAAALASLAARLHTVGQPEEALEAAAEAVDLYRVLAAQRPAVFRPDLASSLVSLCLSLSALGRREAALRAAQEAVDLHRALAAQAPEAFRAELASSLAELAVSFSELGELSPALEASRESTDLYRELAVRHPDAFLPDLARSLNNLANRCCDLGQGEAAVGLAEEAVALYQGLAAHGPEMFRPGLAMGLHTLAVTLDGVGEHERALTAAQQSVAIHRELAAQCEVFRPDLARSLSNLPRMLGAVGHLPAALTSAQEAVAVYRVLAARQPHVFRPDLARSLGNLAHLRAALGEHDPALEAGREAAALCRDLAVQAPESFRGGLARSLEPLAQLLQRLGQPADAQQARDLTVRCLDAAPPGGRRALQGKAQVADAPGETRRPGRNRRGYVPPARRNKVMMTTFAAEDLRDRFNKIATAAGMSAQELLRHLIGGVVRTADDDPSFLGVLAEQGRAACSEEPQTGSWPVLPGVPSVTRLITSERAASPSLGLEVRCPIVLLLDVSPSMAGRPLEELNAGLRALKEELAGDPLAQGRVEIAIVTFGPVRVASPFTPAEQFRPPVLVAQGEAPLGSAILHGLDLLRERTTLHRARGILYHRPWVFLITEGKGADAGSDATAAVRQGEESGTFAFFAVGVQGADLGILRQISVRDPLPLTSQKLKELFVWLSSSLRRVSHSVPGTPVPLPSPAGWSSI